MEKEAGNQRRKEKRLDMEEIKLTIASVKELYQKGKVTPKKLIEQIIQKAELDGYHE